MAFNRDANIWALAEEIGRLIKDWLELGTDVGHIGVKGNAT
jgi:hypothetical protein